MEQNMLKAGLLILSKPIASNGIMELLDQASGIVRGGRLYIHLAKLDGADTNSYANSERVRRFIAQTYTASSASTTNLDVRVLLGNVGSTFKPQSLGSVCEVLLTNSQKDDHADVMDYARRSFNNISDECIIYYVATNLADETDEPSGVIKTYDNVALGGTFDSVHCGHKILLSEALTRAAKSLTIGVTDGPMNQSKVLCEMIAPIDERIETIRELVTDLKPYINYNIVPITNPYGPTITDPSLQCLVVSTETMGGGKAVNEKRQEVGMNPLEIHSVELVKDNLSIFSEDKKISSSTIRRRKLGTLLKKPMFNNVDQMRPYVIGLSGGIATGKTTVCKKLGKLGAAVIDCDKLAHETYKNGTSTYHAIIKKFGTKVVGSDHEIDRKVLGSIVFSNKELLNNLNCIVWPEIAQLAMKQIKLAHKNGIDIVVLDAAVLIEAGWQSLVHEVWITILPVEETVKRIMNRNNLTAQEAMKRINSQLTNSDRLPHAHVVLSSLWEQEYTQGQVEKAWDMLMARMHYE